MCLRSAALVLLAATATAAASDIELVTPILLQTDGTHHQRGRQLSMARDGAFAFEISTSTHGTFHAEVSRNLALFASAYTETTENTVTGEIVTVRSGPQKDHCHFSGRVVGDNTSLVAVSVCPGSGMRGLIRVSDEEFAIEPVPGNMGVHHVEHEFRALGESLPDGQTCGHPANARAADDQGGQHRDDDPDHVADHNALPPIPGGRRVCHRHRGPARGGVQLLHVCPQRRSRHRPERRSAAGWLA